MFTELLTVFTVYRNSIYSQAGLYTKFHWPVSYMDFCGVYNGLMYSTGIVLLHVCIVFKYYNTIPLLN